MPDLKQLAQSKYLPDLKNTVQELASERGRAEKPLDVSFEDYIKGKHSVSMSDFYSDLGIDMSVDTIQNIISVPNQDVRWLLPEIYGDAIRLGMRRSPFFQDLIAAETTIKGLVVHQPMINMSDAKPLITGIAETIRLGDWSFDAKQVTLKKYARGIKIPYEMKNFVSLDVVSLFLEDFGVLAGQALTNLAILTLINGDQEDGSGSAAVIGVKTPGTLVYRDLTRPFVRGGLLGKRFNDMIAGETMTLDILDLDQFSKPVQGSPEKKLNVKTPMPDASNLYVHGGVPDTQVIILDPSSALIKYNAQPLLIESEKIVSNQTDAVYASFMTGFGILWQDSRIIVDSSLDIETDGFPDYMDPLVIEAATQFEK